MKSSIITTILIVLSVCVSAQKQFLSITGGLSQTNTSTFLDPTDSRHGFSSRLGYEYLFNNNLSLGAGFSYNQRGFIDESIFVDGQGNPTGEKATNEVDYDYISFPLKSSYYFGKKWYGFIGAGFLPSILINSKVTTTVHSGAGQESEDSYDLKESTTSFDLAGFAELGGGYKLHDRYWLFTSVSYQHSFTATSSTEFFSNTDIHHVGTTISLGLIYKLAK